METSLKLDETGTPGHLLVGVLPIGALVLLVLNDYVWKGHGPALLTGKLSDAAGLFVFPILLLSAVEAGRFVVRRPWLVDLAAARIACLVSGIGFALVKTVPVVSTAYAEVIGALRWPVLALKTLISDGEMRAPVPIDVVRDPTDLWTLAFVLLSYGYLAYRISREGRPDNAETLAPVRPSARNA